MTTAKTGCLSSPPVMNPRLGAKERSKSTGWSSSTVICVRGAGQGCFFRYKTGSISVTGSLSAARTRVYDTNPPLVGLVGLVFSDYRRYAWFSCRSTQDRKRSPRRSKMAIPDPSKAGSPFCALQTGGWNHKTPEINNFYSRNYSAGGLDFSRFPPEGGVPLGP